MGIADRKVMAVRMLAYIAQLHQQNLAMNKKKGLPSRVASAVVYNGKGRWDAHQEFASLLPGETAGDDRVFGQLRYLLVDGNSVGKREGLVALLFALERAGEKEFRPLVERLARRLRGPGCAELRRSFAIWLQEELLRERSEGQVREALQELEDERMHLPERMSWVQEARLEGRSEGLRRGIRKGMRKGLEKGLEQGLEKGLDEGRLELAASVLRRRFGSLSAEHLKRLREADPEELAMWIERSFASETLEDVFRSSDRTS